MPTPVTVVRTAEDEIAWERAKEIARKQYPGVTGDRFYRIVMGIYKKMAHYVPSSRERRRRQLNQR
jgi:hypothetical protein